MDLSKLPRTQLEFEERFRTEEACVEFLRDERWADGFRCPKCEGTKAWRLASRPLDECVECGHQVSLIAGTVFQGTRKPLRLWFRVIGQFVTSKSGCSATDVERQQGIHYQTAWTWLHKLRSCISQSGRAKLQGSVEVDESYVGGEDEPAHTGRSLKGHKTVVVAAAEWKDDAIGRIRAEAVPNATANSVCGFVEGNVAKGSTVKTDGFQGYASLNKRGYVHNREVIGNPKRAAKAMPHIHRVFALLDRLLLGTYQGSVSGKYLQCYLDEFVFRFNRRRAKNRWQLFGRLLEECFQVPPSYAALVASAQAVQST